MGSLEDISHRGAGFIGSAVIRLAKSERYWSTLTRGIAFAWTMFEVFLITLSTILSMQISETVIIWMPFLKHIKRAANAFSG